MKTTIYTLTIVIIFSLLAYGGWQLQRWLNYSWGYKNDVQQEICKMVKHEHSTEYGKNNCK